MLIEAMPRVLRWQDSADLTWRVHRSYLDLLSAQLGEICGRLARSDPPLAAALVGGLGDAPDGALLKVLSAPETSFRLLWRSASDAEAVQFILQALWAEQARADPGLESDRLVWSAFGDMAFGPGPRRLAFPQIAGFAPLDFGSPLAAAVDLGGPPCDLSPPREPFSPAEMAEAVGRIEAALAGLGRVSPLVAAFVVEFNAVLILQKDPQEPNAFSSGSTGQYVGRSFLTNPHLAEVGPELIAEALVHEGVHALLYMQERLRPWVADPELYGPTPRVRSPWTGNPLALRPYIQACFVWFALAQFWGLALAAGGFDRAAARARFEVAVSGFLAGPLLAVLKPYAGDVAPELLTAIDAMQGQIVASLAEVAAP